MYTKRIEIPQVGETRNLPSVAGEAVDVIRLDWVGAEDPLGNPRLKADRGQIDQPLSERHPVRADFRGLRIENRDDEAAAGTLALLRIYEDATNLTQTPPRRQPVIDGAQQVKPEQLSASFTQTVSGGYGDPSRTLSAEILGGNRSVAYRVWVSMYIRDPVTSPDDITSGFRNVTLSVDIANRTVGVWAGSLEVGGDEEATIIGGVIVPKGDALSVGVEVSGDGEGTFDAGAKGLALYDPKSQVPPR